MKELAKNCARKLSLLLVLPVILCYFCGSNFFNSKKWFQLFSQLFALLPGAIGEYLRREFYRYSLKSCSDSCCISFGTIFSSPDVEVGENVYIGAYCIIGRSSIGNDSIIASRVSIISGKKQHGIELSGIPIREQTGVFERVTIGKDVWIGEGSIVSVDISDHCVVGCGSVVTKTPEQNSIIAGNPAVLIRNR